MTIDWTQIIISLCSLIITGILIPLINAKIKETKNKLSAEATKEIEYWTAVGVKWAKQWLQSETGEKKKAAVMTFLTVKLRELGLNVSEEDLDKIIEAVYCEIKDSLPKNVDIIE